MQLTLAKVNDHTDKATICFDSNNTKSTLPDSGDYCFIATVGENQPVLLQGGSELLFTNHYKKISNPPELEGVGGVSDRMTDTLLLHMKVMNLKYQLI